MVVSVDGVDVARIVNAHVDELVTVADLVVGVGVHLVIGEGLINNVAARINGQVANLVVIDQKGVSRIDGIANCVNVVPASKLQFTSMLKVAISW